MTDGSLHLGTINVNSYSYSPTPNAALAAELGMPSSTLFFKPDRAGGYVDYRATTGADTQTAWFDDGDDSGGSTPAPTAADPAPPEIINDDSEAIAICLSPDVCRAPNKPTPFMTYGTANNDFNYSPDVFSNGLRVKHQQSKFSCCFGDEAGIGLGCKSNTLGDVVEPVTSSQIVFVNGMPVQRHGDQCTLNAGNTVGEYCYVGATDVAEAPPASDEQDKAWYENAWDWTGEKLNEAGQAISEFDQNNGRIVTRSVGGLQAIGGAAETLAGAALAGVGGVATGTGVGAAPGVPAMIGGGLLVVNGADNFQAGLRQAWTGESTATAIASASGDVARLAGASEQTAQTVENTVGMVQGVAGGTGALAAGMRVTGRTAATAGAGGMLNPSSKTVGRAVAESGEQGARSTNALGEAHNAAIYARYRELLNVTEQANPLVESLRNTGKLPPNYVTKADAAKAGWAPGKAVGNYVPGGQIGGDVFDNTTNILPPAAGRTWQEADVGLVNTMSRKKQPGTRLLYSNDGLLYVTSDHYDTVTSIGTWK
ncbi:PAAR-like domain-containing protein [Neorhizobium sp. JUb45]|uniref:PAAR-like domain-containing protein n=1 Tax=Neorhizobium sp. JUb45 TaxID=2485113 RepID=UPI0010429EF0|nr:PAAR-like domain-containing protein [Neorhizobium sp. JUb45]TCQ99298.1 ribonuclease [Neorhizobium sp. JUb45]